MSCLLESSGMSDPLPNTLRLNQFRGAAMLIMFSVLASRIIGFAREMYIASAFGAQGQNRCLCCGVHNSGSFELPGRRRSTGNHVHPHPGCASGKRAKTLRAIESFPLLRRLWGHTDNRDYLVRGVRAPNPALIQT